MNKLATSMRLRCNGTYRELSQPPAGPTPSDASFTLVEKCIADEVGAIERSGGAQRGPVDGTAEVISRSEVCPASPSSSMTSSELVIRRARDHRPRVAAHRRYPPPATPR
ncbi:hypothetical protein ACJJTC_005278 [Scirpophaga incertulas]